MKERILTRGFAITAIVGSLFLTGCSVNSFNSTTAAQCFEFDTTTGTITGYLDICDIEVVIPEKINNTKVVKIGSYAFKDKGITKVVLSSSIKEVGIGAFYNNKIKTLKLNEGLEIIKPLAFLQNQITKLDIPTTVTAIGMEAFNNNTLRDRDAFIYQRNTDSTEDKTLLIGYGGKNNDITIPEGVVTLYLSALAENNLKTVTFSNTVERIEYNALANNKITEIVIPKNIVHIGEEALSNNPIVKISIEGKKSLGEFNYLGSNWNNGCEEIKFKNK